jgi:dephospho-CoA kinase
VKRVGITGGIGAGKSLVCEIFRILGAPVFDADSRARELMNSDTKLKEQVTKLLGAGSYVDGSLNRKFVADQVFNNQPLLESLNQLVHPAVAKDFERWASKHVDKGYVVKEAALLFETGSYRSLDMTILVTAPESTRVARTEKRDRRTVEEIQAIMEKQMSDAEKEKLADTVLKNDGQELLLPQVLAIHNMLK